MTTLMTLRALTGELRGQEFTLRGPSAWVLGRAPDCQLRLPCDATVSRRHCLIELEGGAAWVQDLGSLNGTHLNGEPIGRRRPGAVADATLVIPLRRALHDGDELRVCNSLFAVALSGAPGEPIAPGAERHRTTLPDGDEGNWDRGRREGA
jgi:pSer/pThr/pTyr-binding forkhead associated (FHA) protein